MSIITLLTDFGVEDSFVAIMKGVILGIAPTVTIVDVTHQVPAFNRIAAGISWLTLAPWYPAGTIHVAVVDPGVGTARAILAVQLMDQWFLCPDNGLITPLLQTYGPAQAIREVTNSALMAPKPHPTFHGRDIFAPVAAHLALGVPIEEVGPPATPSETLPWRLPSVAPGQIDGQIFHIDHFGNCWTNIRREHLVSADISPEWAEILISGEHRVKGIARSYGERHKSPVLVLENSSGFIEVGIFEASAARVLDLAIDDVVSVSAGG